MPKTTVPLTTHSNDELLQYAISSGMLDLTAMLEQMNMAKRNEVKKKYKDKIKWREDKKLYYIYINRKPKAKKTYDELIDMLVEYEIENEKAEQAKAETLATLYPHFVMWKKEQGKADQTLRDYVTNWNRFLKNDELANRPLVELDVSDFANLFSRWTKGGQLTYKRFVTAKSLLNGIITFAIQERKIIKINYASQVNCKDYRFMPVDNSKEVYTNDTKKKLLDSLQDDEMYSLAIQFSFFVTIRIGELLSLKWSDVKTQSDIECVFVHSQKQVKNDITMVDGEIVVGSRYFENVPYTKSRKKEGFRYLPLTDKAKALLTTVKKLNPDGEYIFMKDGKQLDRTTFNNQLERHCKKSDIDYHSSHKIRFNTISTLHDKGLTLPEIMEFAGHSHMATTVNYLRNVKNETEVFDRFRTALS